MPTAQSTEPRSPRLNQRMKALLGALSEAPVTIPRPYLGLTGDLAGGYMLNQVIYWSDRGGAEDGSFYKSVKEWVTETGLAKHTINKWLTDFEARGWLISLGLKKVKGAPTSHWAFNSALFIDDLMGFIQDPEAPPIYRNQQIPDLPKSANGMAEIGKSLFTIDYNNRLQHKTITEGGQPPEPSKPRGRPRAKGPVTDPPQEVKAGAQPQRAKAKAEDSPAVQAYLAWVEGLPPQRRVTPTRTQLEEIADSVSSAGASLELWAQTLKRWELAGYYAGNVLNIIDSYKKGGPSKDGNRAPPRSPAPPQQPSQAQREAYSRAKPLSL